MEVPVKKKVQEPEPKQERKSEPIKESEKLISPEPLTLQAPPLTKMKIESERDPINPEKIRTGFINEAEDDWIDDVFLDIPYEDEIIEPIDDYPNYEATLVDNEVVYRLQEFYSRKSRSQVSIKEEIVDIAPVKKEKEKSVKEEEVNAVQISLPPYDDESKILPSKQQTMKVEIGK